ncbi:type II toxin-antitoxin system TacA family antitoxin [Aquirufa nivalisilvae]|uniref:type II toxin-antitoxin system TacA family antitoxin n=1 Tax=Aquirufa nivalisilvae TaxID=2516557 RepID=UPI001032F8D0|nr:DUF1778 domain-containing protein [Aquirufa nivalisilvae]TBH76517.1 DUF1778 domain-containing protein [Aquirufa nivalisilvae]
MKSSIKEQSRFDARLPKEQKQLFEKAATLGGYRNLSDFVFQSAQEKAQEIIQQQELILASEKDAQLFFDAITHANKPKESLKKALKEYQQWSAKL